VWGSAEKCRAEFACAPARVRARFVCMYVCASTSSLYCNGNSAANGGCIASKSSDSDSFFEIQGYERDRPTLARFRLTFYVGLLSCRDGCITDNKAYLDASGNPARGGGGIILDNGRNTFKIVTYGPTLQLPRSNFVSRSLTDCDYHYTAPR
jgi:hypothetical protein